MAGVVPTGAAVSAASDMGASVDASVGGEFAGLLDQAAAGENSEETIEVSDTFEYDLNPMTGLPIVVSSPSANQRIIDLPLTEEAAQALLKTDATNEPVTASVEVETPVMASPQTATGPEYQAAEDAGAAAIGVAGNTSRQPALAVEGVSAGEPSETVMAQAKIAIPADMVAETSDAPMPTTPHAERDGQSAQPAPAVIAGDQSKADAEPARIAPVDAPLEVSAQTGEMLVQETATASEQQTARPASPAPAAYSALPVEPARKYTAEARLEAEAEDAGTDRISADGNALDAVADSTDEPATTPPAKDATKTAFEAIIGTAANASGTREPDVVDATTQPVEPSQLEEAQTSEAKGTQLSHATLRTTAELAAAMISRLGHRTTRFDMVLTPETLGNVEVSIEIGDDGQMSARLAFENPQAANELRARADELRRQLADAGFDVSERSLEFTDRESDPRGGFNQFMSDSRSGRRAFMGAARVAEMADTPVAPVWTPLNLARTGVDMKV